MVYDNTNERKNLFGEVLMKKFLVVLCFILITSTIVHASSFEDVEGLNCEQAVENLVHIGIVNGMSEKEYAPKKSVTRAELAKLVVSALDLKGTSEKTFSDIQGHWGESFINEAAAHGILNGYTDGTFGPDKEVSYAEAVAILVRSLGYENVSESSAKWYDQYLAKMKELSLDEGVEKIEAEESATRGDIAILLWNTICSETKGTSLLEQNFSEFQWINNEKITSIDVENGKIIYRTEHSYFYVDNKIDFSNLGGMASGLLNTKEHTISNLTVDQGRNLKKIAGVAKEISAKGYEVFECKNILGYGTKENANYVEIFVNADTNQTERVVYYDTTESHFAIQIKMGIEQIKIESKVLYDDTTVIDNGQTINVKVRREETEKEISTKAILVYDGKIVPWTSMPDNSVVRELKKDTIYTYIHEYQDIPLTSKQVSSKGITIEGKEYRFSEDCIAENVKLDTAMKLSGNLTREDLNTIAEKDGKVRVYFNEFDEIVKIEFSYDIWKIHQEEEVVKEHQDLSDQLKKIGIVSSFGYVSSEKESDDDKVKSRILPIPSKNSFTFTHGDGAFRFCVFGGN